MCFYITDRMLQSLPMLQWKPSIQAAAAIYLGRKYLTYDNCWVLYLCVVVMGRIRTLKTLRE